MNTQTQTQPTSKWRILGWGSAAALLLTPLVAMQFTPEVNWSAGDFVFAALMFGTVGLLIELAVRMSSNGWYRAGAALAVLSGFVTVWVNGAVGMIGDEGAPVNLALMALVPLSLIGAALARFRARPMAWVMAMAGSMQAAIAILAILWKLDPRGGVLTLALSGLWFLSAILLRQAGRAGTVSTEDRGNPRETRE